MVYSSTYHCLVTYYEFNFTRSQINVHAYLLVSRMAAE